MQGIIKVTIMVRLNSDVDEETVKKFVDYMDYEIKDTTGKVSIESTEIIDFE